MAARESILSLTEVSKSYGAARALAEVDLEVAAGAVHAVVGENGAGKSTLGMIIAGVVTADAGTIRFAGEEVDLRSPREALECGIAMIRQEISLVPQLTVEQNVVLGLEPSRAGVLDRGAADRVFAEARSLVDFDLPRGAKVGSLPLAGQQQVEILRALARRAAVIVMDEPTSSLGAEEAAKLYATIERVCEAGTTVVYVSHFLDEVLKLADTVTVMRNGRRVRTGPAAEETKDRLVTAMLGREASLELPPTPPPRGGAPVVRVRGLRRGRAVRDVGFEIQAGEVLGLAGLAGSGRTEVARALFGADRPDAGEIVVDGRSLRHGSPTAAVEAGLAFVPESRRDEGLIMTSSQRANVSLPHVAELSRFGVVSKRAERARTDALVERVDIRSSRPEQSPLTLSGGNQQKLLLAKWLFEQPSFLILDEPTRGVDVGARRSIHETVQGLAAEGVPVLLISSDLEEITALAHRILVMSLGRIVAEFHGPGFEESEIVAASFASGAEV